jgi:branched-chain amino acid transport system substrate-binding protein
MNFARLTALAAAGVTAGTMAAGPAMAELVVPVLSYRTGPYAPSGIPYADGITDYFTMLNERDGGIGGEKVRVTECETAYNTEKGVECYESTKGQGSLIYSPLSTGITYQLIPKVSADEIPMHTMGYGRTSAVNGKIFPWIFNFPGNYWDAASVIIKHIIDQEGSEDLSGKKITLVYHNSAYGKEPIRTLEELAKKHGYTFTAIPVDHPGQEQKSQWLQIRRDQPDYVALWGWGVMNQVAIQEAANIRFPMDKFIGVWYSASEADVLPAGAGADGYKAVAFHAPGRDFPLYDDIQTHVVDKGLAAGDGTHLGEVLYNRGIYQAVSISEAIRQAQEATGTAQITPAQLRDALDSYEITAERWAEIGLPDFAAPVKITCEDHGGPGVAAISQWDADSKTWSLITGFIEPDHEILDPMVEEDSMAYAQEAGIEPRECPQS